MTIHFQRNHDFVFFFFVLCMTPNEIWNKKSVDFWNRLKTEFNFEKKRCPPKDGEKPADAEELLLLWQEEDASEGRRPPRGEGEEGERSERSEGEEDSSEGRRRPKKDCERPAKEEWILWALQLIKADSSADRKIRPDNKIFEYMYFFIYD